jgi:protein-arginine kinase activator protein McsA
MEKTLQQLEAELAEMLSKKAEIVARQRYEEAARFRDEVKALEAQIAELKNNGSTIL